ncbi:MAG: hypothetical protein J5544_01775 [Clostridia bacterium]|nr:hypothetical protein [Clostridia bacterium]
MKVKKASAVVLAVLPLVLFAAGLVMYAIFHFGAKADPVYWREHMIEIYAFFTLAAAAILAIPCGIVARVLIRYYELQFVSVVTIVEFVIPVVFVLLLVFNLL